VSGGTAKLTVPASAAVPTATHLRVRVRGYDGTDYSKAWSGYVTFVMNTVAPAGPAIDCPSYPDAEWTAKASSAVTCTLDTTSSDGQGYQWALDDPNPTTYVEDTTDGNGGDALTVSINPPTAGTRSTPRSRHRRQREHDRLRVRVRRGRRRDRLAGERRPHPGRRLAGRPRAGHEEPSHVLLPRGRRPDGRLDRGAGRRRHHARQHDGAQRLAFGPHEHVRDFGELVWNVGKTMSGEGRCR
jgi:hypothetical protein